MLRWASITYHSERNAYARLTLYSSIPHPARASAIEDARQSLDEPTGLWDL